MTASPVRHGTRTSWQPEHVESRRLRRSRGLFANGARSGGLSISGSVDASKLSLTNPEHLLRPACGYVPRIAL